MNGFMTSCGIATWAACEWAAEAGYLPSWAAIALIVVAAYIVGKYGSRLLGMRANVR